MQDYKDTRTTTVKNMLRAVIYQNHMSDLTVDFDGNSIYVDDGFELPRQEEEIVTEMCYQMQETYYPEGEIIYNKGDVMDSIMFVISGSIKIIIKADGTSEEALLDILVKNCSFGYHAILKIVKNEDELFDMPTCDFKLEADADCIVLRL